MTPVVDPGPADGSRGTAGLVPLAGLNVLLSAGPLLAQSLPAGPGSLLVPQSTAVAAAELCLLWILLVWPGLERARGTGRVAGGGAAILLVSLPFVVGNTLVWGGRIADAAAAASVLAAAALVTGVYMTGPGRVDGRDRYFTAGTVLVLAALPFANYALNEMGGVSGSAGYDVSPALALRRSLLALPGGDPRSCLLLSLGIAGLLAAGRLSGRSGAAAAILLLLAGSARAEEARVAPLLGEIYVPGRALPLIVRVDPAPPVSVQADGEPRVWVEVPGHGRFAAPAAAEGAVVAVPGSEGLGPVRLRAGETGDWIDRSLSLKAAPPGNRLLVSLGPVPESVSRWAQEAGFSVSRAAAGAERFDARWLLAADAVLDSGGRLAAADVGRLEAAGVTVLGKADAAELGRASTTRGLVRRTWEEADTVLSPEPLWPLFPVEVAYERGRAVAAFCVLAVFAAVAVALIRYLGRRETGHAGTALALGLAASAAFVALLVAVPALPEVRESRLRVREGGREVTIRRFKARREGVALTTWAGPPLVLDAGEGTVVERDADGRFLLALPLSAHQARIVVAESFGPYPDDGGEHDLLVSKAGLARAGEPALPPKEFLDRELIAPPWRAHAVRKLLRIAPLPAGRYAVRFGGPKDLSVEVIRLAE